MQTHKLQQGAPEWHEFRANHFTASDAATMLGKSKYSTRNELLELKKAGIQKEVSESLQKIFDKGHEAEEEARPVAEKIIGEELYPVTGSAYVDGLPLSASFDGITLMNDTCWEHKLLNKELDINLSVGIIPDYYKYQLEQQLLISGASRVLFMASSPHENEEHTYYESDEKIRAELIAGWHQFQEDLLNFEVKDKVEEVEAEKVGLPEIAFSMHNKEISSNITACLMKFKEMSSSEIDRVIETDQDFADRELLSKDIKIARNNLKLTIKDAESHYPSFCSFLDEARKIDKVLQKLQSHGEKQVKEEKERKKGAIIFSYANDAIDYARKLEDELEISHEPVEQPDWNAAMKGKKVLIQ